MKKIFLFVWIALSGTLYAQEKPKQLGLGVQVFYSSGYWTKSPQPVDSLNALDKGLMGISPQLWYIVELNRKLTIQAGVQYSTAGFKRRAADVKYLGKYHPDMPVITDNVQGDPRHIDFIYRSHYLGIPVFFNYEIIALRKTISLHYFFTPGVSMGFLVYDKTIAYTRGYGYDGKNRFVLNNIYDGNIFNAQLHLGGRVEYMVSGKYRAHLQPVLNMPLTSVFRGGNRAYVPSVGVNVFLTLLPGKEDIKE